MRAGIQVYNQDDFLQIDDRFTNFRLVNKQSKVRGGGGSWGLAFQAAVFSLKMGDVIAISSNGPFQIGRIRASSSNEFIVAVVTPNASQVVTGHTFRQDAPPDSGYGMQLFSESGSLVFDAASDFLTVHSSAPQQVTGSRTYELQPGRKYGIIFGQWSGTLVQSGYRSPDIPDLSFVTRQYSSPRFNTSVIGKVSALPEEIYDYSEIPVTGAPPPTTIDVIVGGDLIFADITNL
jgi:hypothetical protein